VVVRTEYFAEEIVSSKGFNVEPLQTFESVKQNAIERTNVD